MTIATGFLPWAGGKKAPPGSLTDGGLRELFERYKRAVAKRYRVVDPQRMQEILPQGKLWVSTKVDGELWYLVKRGSVVSLCAPNGRVLEGTSLLQALAKSLEKAPDVVLAGEIFSTPPEGRARVQHVGRALGDESMEKLLSFQAFDLVEEAGESGLSKPYDERLARIKSWLPESGRASVVTTVETDVDGAQSYYREWVATQRFEGLVVRSDQGITYKVKPTFTLDAVIVAFGERVTADVAQVREISVALIRDDGSLQLIGPVGGGFTEEDRVEWHKKLSPLESKSSFRMANREGTLCRFVKPEIVVEVQLSDLIETDADDKPIRRMALSYDATEGYRPLGDVRVAAMLFPVFKRERPDKNFTLGDVGMTQMTSRLPDDVLTKEAPKPRKAAAILDRGVWVKETKGQTAVRKYVVVATHKEDHGYPPFLAHFTDFSAGRAEPLKTSLRSASSEDRIRNSVQAWVDENVKKGWNPASGSATSERMAAPDKAAEVVEIAAEKPKSRAKKAEVAVDGEAPAEKPKKPRAKKADPEPS